MSSTIVVVPDVREDERVVERAENREQPEEHEVRQRRNRKSENVGVLGHVGVPLRPDYREPDHENHAQSDDQPGVRCEVEFAVVSLDSGRTEVRHDEQCGQIRKQAILPDCCRVINSTTASALSSP